MADAKIINYGQQISAGSTAIPDDNTTALDIESTDAKDYILISTADGSEKLTLKAGGHGIQVLDAGAVMSTKSNSWALLAEDSTATNPVLIPYSGDGDTGIGRADADALSLIAGSQEGIRITEASNATTTQINGKALVKGDLSDEMTGTVEIESGTLNTLVGSGTAFLTEIFEGSAVKVDSQIFSVVSVASNTSAVLDSNASGAVAAGTKIYTDNSPMFQVQSGDSRSLLEANNNYVRINGRGGPSTRTPTNSEVALFIDGAKPVDTNTDSVGLEINCEGSNGAQLYLTNGGNYVGRFMAQQNKLYLGTQYANQDVVLYPGSRNIMTIRGDDYAAVLQDSDIKLYQNEASAAGQEICFYKSRNTTDESAATIVNDNDILGEIKWKGADGNSFATGARIFARVDVPSSGNLGDGDMPTELVFETTPDGTETPVARMTLGNKGLVATTTDAASCKKFQRTSSSDSLEIRLSSGTEFNTGGNKSIKFTHAYREVMELEDETLVLENINFPYAGTNGGLWVDLANTCSSSGTGNRTIASTGHKLKVGDAVALPSGNDGGSGQIYEVFTVATVTDANTFVVDSDLTNSISSAVGNTDGTKLEVKTGDGAVRFAVAGDGVMTLGTNPGVDMGNIAIGDADALDAITTGGQNLIIGHASGTRVLSTGSRNVFQGFQSAENVTTGEQNVAVGHYTMGGCSADADRVTALGYKAGYTGNDDCTYIGAYAGEAVTSLSNVAIGSYSMVNDGPEQSTAVGRSAHNACTGDYNAVLGAYALDASGAAAKSAAVGHSALSSATGIKNTALGYESGDSITDGTENICIGHQSDAGASNVKVIAIGNQVAGSTNQRAYIGDGSNQATLDFSGASNSWTATSDSRIKENVQDGDLGLDFINSLRTVKYTEINPADWPEEIRSHIYFDRERTRTNNDGEEETYTEPANERPETNTKVFDGLIAQEVIAAATAAGSTFSGIDDGESNGLLRLQYERMVIPLIKAVQELTARIEQLEGGD